MDKLHMLTRAGKGSMKRAFIWRVVFKLAFSIARWTLQFTRYSIPVQQRYYYAFLTTVVSNASRFSSLSQSNHVSQAPLSKCAPSLLSNWCTAPRSPSQTGLAWASVQSVYHESWNRWKMAWYPFSLLRILSLLQPKITSHYLFIHILITYASLKN